MSADATPFDDPAAWHALGEALRGLARQEILPRFHHVRATTKADGSPVTEADRAMQGAMADWLARHWPTYAFLGEESACRSQERALAAAEGCWILDPLDGTTNFTHGFELFATSLALSIDGRVVLGLVYDPIRDELFGARRGRGAELDGHPLRIGQVPERLGDCLALIDFKRLPPALARALAAEAPYASQRNLGTVALDWCWLAAGRADLYLHGGQKLWDHAAGHLIFTEAGGAATTLTGEPIAADTLAPLSAVAAGSASLLARWRRALDELDAHS